MDGRLGYVQAILRYVLSNVATIVCWFEMSRRRGSIMYTWQYSYQQLPFGEIRTQIYGFARLSVNLSL